MKIDLKEANFIFGIKNGWLLCSCCCYIKRVCTWSIEVINSNSVKVKNNDKNISSLKSNQDRVRRREKSKMMSNLGLDELLSFLDQLSDCDGKYYGTTTIRNYNGNDYFKGSKKKPYLCGKCKHCREAGDSLFHWKRLRHKFGSREA